MTHQAKYVRVKTILKDHIQNRYSVGMKIPSTVNLGEELGVSEATVNRAIRDLVDEGLLERFRRRGTFVARGNRTRGFVWPVVTEAEGSDPHKTAILRGVEHEAHSRDEHVVLRGLRHGAGPVFLETRGGPPSGMIILYSLSRPVVREYHKRRIPVVLVEPFVRQPGVPVVACDNFGAAYEATAYLARLGHRRIVHATVAFPLPCVMIEERIQGYREAMQEMNLESLGHVHTTAIGTGRPKVEEDDVVDEQAAVGDFLAMLDDVQPTACCCFDDLRAVWVTRICHDHGIRIPEDLSIVGVNDDGPAAQIWPGLTTVHLPLEQLGRTAVRMLDEVIERGDLGGESRVLPGVVVERASVKRLNPEGRGVGAERPRPVPENAKQGGDAETKPVRS